MCALPAACWRDPRCRAAAHGLSEPLCVPCHRRTGCDTDGHLHAVRDEESGGMEAAAGLDDGPCMPGLGSVALGGADLSGADLTDADLTGAIWYNTLCPDGTNKSGNSPCTVAQLNLV